MSINLTFANSFIHPFLESMSIQQPTTARMSTLANLLLSQDNDMFDKAFEKGVRGSEANGAAQ